MSSNKWLKRLHDFQNNPRGSTPKTPETPLLGVSGVGGGGVPGKNDEQTCDRCQRMSRSRTCLEPVAAGLADKSLPVWCDLMKGHGRTCPAYMPSNKD